MADRKELNTKYGTAVSHAAILALMIRTMKNDSMEKLAHAVELMFFITEMGIDEDTLNLAISELEADYDAFAKANEELSRIQIASKVH